MALAEQFQEILDSLPDDWTDLTLDMRLPDEERYVDAAVILTQINAQPYSKADWHWRINVAHNFGHAAAAETVKGTLALLDQEGIAAELVLRDFREGRAEVNADVGAPRVRSPPVPSQPQALAAPVEPNAPPVGDPPRVRDRPALDPGAERRRRNPVERARHLRPLDVSASRPGRRPARRSARAASGSTGRPDS